MRQITPDRFDDLRHEWITEHAGIWNIQKRRAEKLNRQIRKRIRMTAGARPNPYDDNLTHPHWARKGSTVEITLEGIIILAGALMAPIGWTVGRLMYETIIQFIPNRLRAYPIPALLYTAGGIGLLTVLLYSPDDSLTRTLLAPYLLAQIPAAFAFAAIYGVLNGWLAIDGSTTWWPITPPPLPVDLHVPFGPDDLTAPPVFATGEPETAADMTPVTQVTQSLQSLRLVQIGLAVCAIGAAWMIGAVAIGIKDVLTDAVSSSSWTSPSSLTH